MKQLPNLALIKLFMIQSNFNRWYGLINKDILTDEQRMLFNDFYIYYKENDTEQLVPTEFLTWFSQIKHTNLTKTEYELFEEMILTADTYKLKHPDSIIKHFHLLEMQTKLQDQIQKGSFNENSVDLIVSEFKNKLTKTDYEQQFDRSTINELFDSAVMNPLFTYKLKTLNWCLSGIFSDDLIIVGAPEHTGKSAFLCDLAIHVAKQTDKKIYYLTNEESAYRVKNRLVQACCLQYKREKTNADFAKSFYLDFTKCSNELKEKIYVQEVGDFYKIEVVDISSESLTELKALINKLPNPGLIVVDMLNKVRTIAGASHEQQKVRSETFKDLAKHVCPIVTAYQGAPSTSWLDKETGTTKIKKWVSKNDLEGAKNSCSPADVFIGIGRDVELDSSRFICVDKNRHGKLMRQEVLFIGEESNYLDL